MRKTILFVAMPLAAALIAFAPASAKPTTPAKPAAAACDRDCLIRFADIYMSALVAHDPAQVPWATVVRYSENSVPMMIGEGQWSTVTAKSDAPLYVTDPSTGNVAWFGVVAEHGDPAYYGMRIKVAGGKIAEAEAVIDPKGSPGPFGDPDKAAYDPSFGQIEPAATRRTRAQLIALANGYYSTMQLNNGKIFTRFDPDCQRRENGLSTTEGSAAYVVPGCEAQFKLGLYKIDDRLRDRRFPIVDVARGVVVAAAFIDHAARADQFTSTDGKVHPAFVKFPNSLGLIEAFKIRNGKIYRIEAVFTMLPYYMPSPWVK